MKKSKVNELISESVFEILTEKLCPKGKAYVAKRKAAGEKHGAYLMGRAVKVCKGQITGEAEDAAMQKSAKGKSMYGKMMDEEVGEVNVFGYQTQHFDICPGAYNLYKNIVDGEHGKQDKDLAIRVAKLHDNLFYMEKIAKDSPNIVNDSFIDVAQNTADLIMSGAEKMKLTKEHDYVQNHVDIIKDISKEKAVDEEIEAKDNTEFKLSLKHLLQKHATNLKRGDDDTEFSLTLKHLLDKHVSKGGEEIDEAKVPYRKSGYMGYSEPVNETNMNINEVLALEIDENITEAKYKGKTVKLNKPMRGDSKKFKVYVANGKNKDGSIKVKKVNFGHGGTSAKKRGEKTLKIRKSNPKARAAFRARHNCDNPGPKTMARYWSCKKW